jgi:hypothetical protein
MVSRTAKFGVCVHAWLELAADVDDLVPSPDPDGERAGPGVQDDVGAIIGAGEAFPDEGGMEEVRREFIRLLASRTVFARQ